MAFIRTKKKKTEDVLKTEKQEQKKLRKQQRSKDRQLRLCKHAIFSVSFTKYFWLCILLLDLGGVFVGYSKSFFDFSNPAAKSITCLSIASIFAIISICRIISSFGFNRKLGPGRNDYLKSTVQDSSPLVREMYIILGEKRCAHFWITFILVFASILNFLYVIVVSGILKVMGKDPKLWDSNSWDLSTLKNWEFFMQLHSKIDTWDWSQFLIFCSIVSLVFLFCQYWLVRYRNQKFMFAVENVYGKEKMVDECMYLHRIQRIHHRYKTISFVILCILGSAFYFLFKKIICTIFDKSFSSASPI